VKTITIAFDVDGVLIRNITDRRFEKIKNGADYTEYDKPNEDIVHLLTALSRLKNVRILVWSGGGKDYADMWVDRLKLDKFVWATASKLDKLKPDIAIDDIEDTDLGTFNLIVGSNE
jgi:phosphoglycolate phosphatase-like HAD superfamily hydrolase